MKILFALILISIWELFLTVKLLSIDLITKAFSKFNLLKFICHNLNGYVFLKLYKTFILPIIESSNLCFTPNKTQNDRIEKIQKRLNQYICNKLVKYNFKNIMKG